MFHWFEKFGAMYQYKKKHSRNLKEGGEGRWALGLRSGSVTATLSSRVESNLDFSLVILLNLANRQSEFINPDLFLPNEYSFSGKSFAYQYTTD